jgi:hypothetical protein
VSVPGWNLYALHRTGTRRYDRRPPARCIAARAAWDAFAKKGPVEWVQLLDGFWGCQRPGADIIEEHEAEQYSRDRLKDQPNGRG